ncbi:unnamed protein product [Penicillium salamii]|uniref:Major facilitator superfamily (MFS) profile domain-containing protein n=1 Tax=Penicillium salamii TaxID=1612424 RepID=A0A9W4I518_9EURO|nr:unnamed protein product [Penicillium salamii]CAG7958545.1 unnamed protein product [Penicillium salamii]CAG7959540.1 unnamed protein product [Penicillium salamii]CAG7987179.1 unnamed protein product [Penicillium salamii]CAG8223209.1 unnamed protein product [Penicillium salamii]
MNTPTLFAGRAIAGLAVGQLTMVVPLYISEVSIPEIRGGLVVVQHVCYSWNLDQLLARLRDELHRRHPLRSWHPILGRTASKPTFDPYNDVLVGGCTGQSEASWRLPLAMQILPAVILGFGMLFFPDSPRWLLMKEGNEESLNALSRLRRQSHDGPVLLK